MRWRVFLEGHIFDLDTLVRLFPSGADPSVSMAEDGTYYLSGAAIDRAVEAADALKVASDVLPLLNGAGRAGSADFRPVKLAERLIDETKTERHVFVFAEAHMEGRGRLTVGDPRAPSPSPAASKASSDPVLMEAIRRMGESPDLSWIDLYKIFEVLEEGAGGEAALRKRTGVTKAQISRFTHTANHPGGGGELARHARSRQQPPADPMTVEEGRAVIRELISSW